MKNKIFASIILLIVVAFPFRYAYITPPDTGKWSLFNFLMVVVGLVIVSVLLFTAKPSDKK